MVMSVALPALTGRAVEAIRKGAADVHGHALARAHDRHTLLVLSLVILAVVLARWGFMYWRRIIAGRVSLAVEYDLRERIYRQLQRLELGFFDHQQTGQLMSRATVDLAAVRFFLGYGLVFILQSILTIALAGAVMLVINPGLGLIALVPVPFVVADLLPLRPARAAGDPGNAAAHRRADRRRRGEHLGRPRRQGIRARGTAADALSRTPSVASSTRRWSPRAWKRSTTR